ncbi:MAG: hypothetical protein E7201_03435 [Selenomonas ruminantium]|jgi:hypothetical protein|uniref:Uncharacterized protein n=1 Tax=Selenomonas ruminantium TaxID=971 RepID=A0A927WLV2_SELRU|nr:hypothetical protein [Selenomonas ruminantium]
MVLIIFMALAIVAWGAWLNSVREQLLNRLLEMQPHNSRWQSAKLSDEELDWVAAAGAQNVDKNPFKPKE